MKSDREKQKNKIFQTSVSLLLFGMLAVLLWTGCGKKADSGTGLEEAGATLENGQKEEEKELEKALGEKLDGEKEGDESDKASELDKSDEWNKSDEPDTTNKSDNESEVNKADEPDKIDEPDTLDEAKKTDEPDRKSESDKATESDKTSESDKANEPAEDTSNKEEKENNAPDEDNQADSESEEATIPEPERYEGSTEDLEAVRTTAKVNVRTEPSLEGAVYTLLPKRAEISRIRDEGEWSAVCYDGYLLYIASAYLRAKPVGGGDGSEASGSGYVVVIDPGHQARANTNKEPVGPGSSEMKNKVAGGTRGTATGLAEYELTLQVSEKIRDELEARGYTVIMTRESHEVDLSNSERAILANDNQADAFIRIHANGSNDSSVNGVMTICQTASNPYNAAWYEESRRLSNCVLDEVTAATGAKKQYVWETDTMTGINWAQVPSTILEMGYMTNADEDRRMASDDYQETIAEAVADAVDSFLQE